MVYTILRKIVDGYTLSEMRYHHVLKKKHGLSGAPVLIH